MRLKAHLKSRGMNYKLYRASYSYGANKVTFPLYNGVGDWVGYQAYRPLATGKKKKNDPRLGRYYTRLKYDKLGCFGLECFDPTKRDVYIVEGIFKAATLHRLGYNALAVLTSTPKHMRSWFRILGARYNLIAIGDNDNAGAKLVKIVGRGFQSPMDLDEMTDEAVVELLTIYK